MSNGTPGKYSFLPWVRQGLIAEGLPPDAPGATLTARATVPVTLRVNERDTVPVQVRIHGPGDVIGIDRRQVIRTDPRHLSRGFEPNFLAAIEFDRPDFPWLFTPASADAQGRLRPWICLVVVPRQDGVALVADRDRPLPVLAIASPARPLDELPDLADAWAWAHGQVAGSLAGGPSLGDVLANHGERTVSRLLSPRRLEPGRAYYACVVPAFEIGVKAGLGIPVTAQDEGTLRPAWPAAAGELSSIQLPVYYHWEFTTGAGGDFESLVKLLRARPLPATVGIRELDVSRSDPGLPVIPADSPDAVLGLEGALMSPSTQPKGFTDGAGVAFRAALRQRLAGPAAGIAEPAVVPPTYGGRHANQPAVPADGAAPHWLRQLNLDPRYRAVAAIGTQVVQREQEALMASAWEQAGQIERANRILRQAQLVRAATGAVHRNHVSRLAAGPLLQITRAAHARVAVEQNRTAQLAIALSNTSSAVVTGAFRRVARPRGAVERRALAPQARVVRPFVQDLALQRLRIAPARSPGWAVTIESVETRITRSVSVVVSHARMASLDMTLVPQRPTFTSLRVPELVGTRALTGEEGAEAAARIPQFPPEIPDPEPPPPPPPPARDSDLARQFRAAIRAHQPLIQPFVTTLVGPPVLQLSQLRTTVLAGLDPTVTVPDRVRGLIAAPGTRATGDELEPIMAAPRFSQPMYEAVRDLSQDLLLPGLDGVPDNTVSLCLTNPRFVEAYMVGLNHEMARELLWRGFPTDQRGTCFRQFWDIRGSVRNVFTDADTREDIPEIHTWAAARSLGQNATGGAPGRVVLLLRGEVLRRYPTAMVYAVEARAISGQPAPGLGTNTRDPLFRGSLEPDVSFFGFDLTVAQARGSSTHPGWFFVIQQQPTEPRFGVDVGQSLPAGSHLQPAGNAAATARSFLQRPVRIAMHARDLLPPS
jgi:hypothetical protein